MAADRQTRERSNTNRASATIERTATTIPIAAKIHAPCPPDARRGRRLARGGGAGIEGGLIIIGGGATSIGAIVGGESTVGATGGGA